MDLDDRVRDEAVRLPMGGDRRLGRWGLRQAEDLAGRLVVPVALVGHAVLGSDLDVAGVSGGHGLRGQTGDVVVGVEIHRHALGLLLRVARPAGSSKPGRRVECQA